jgi:hypothetical protein
VPSLPVMPAIATVETEITVVCRGRRQLKKLDRLSEIS